jgi:DNA-directed RNA polymerase
MGYDKASFDDRMAYVEDRLGEIFKWVEDPLKNDGWM